LALGELSVAKAGCRHETGKKKQKTEYEALSSNSVIKRQVQREEGAEGQGDGNEAEHE
jgi:hypothetical protein